MSPQRSEPSSPPAPVRAVSRVAVNLIVDGVVAGVAAPLARWLAQPQGGLLHPLWFVAGGAVTLFVAAVPLRIQQQYWRFSGLADLLRIATASVASAALFSLGLLATGFPLPSLTFPLIHALVLLVMMGGVRVATRVMATRPGVTGARRAVLVGSDAMADLFLRGHRLAGQGLRVVGLISRTREAGQRIHNVPILGHERDIVACLDRLAARRRLPQEIVITDPEVRGDSLAAVLKAAEAHGILVSRTPDLTALRAADRIELRPVPIEDLLNRPPVALDHAGMAQMIGGRTILVTGAGGSIGSELVRQIARLRPGRLLLLDHSEYALWAIDLELSERVPDVPRVALLADVRDAGRIRTIMDRYRPALVFHAAALKHVPMVEANPCEGVLTNIEGTRVVADAATGAGVEAMVLISTDKAVNPSSLMGATKRAAELYCQALDIVARQGDSRSMRCVTVRFGNVLGSTGSVVPLFRRQLEQGGPLTVTHPDMRRYFMTVPEAVGLVLQASVRGTRDDHGAGAADGAMQRATDERLRAGGIFVLDMGPPVRIVDLARQMIRLAGLRPDIDISIRFTGVRPGEKLYEELFHGREAPLATDNPGLLMAVPRVVDLVAVKAALDGIVTAARTGDAATAQARLSALVPEFIHNSDGRATRSAPADAQDRSIQA
ncbi:nucleotide sugar epimerase dehydratase [Ameyamaea chiangmaiensis NBRC 103196]|uniref:Polysaccharide biosynthesis protein n=1 Tax=Ameyamaea chiangmaiensis TaxID=442969 RepID=A0A850PFK9_9PROT|nr:nucleoside-diphosphate sugar epimerase/dehydratase [Ameyamaea chiangmaiensis]MBS4074360.1 polysaccharide biosynthesis protein [Ameyamaea chiangmaiensis]NVN41026.1 polysaccharide biosynthesis protein [Ameyamaea chiangmaiensis]GBQ71775.1 nucleotide sugar epimerase dehydratase [Ameyamaea chiangmaiensis NBRC 103196]